MVYVFYFYLTACGPKGHGSGLPLPTALSNIPITRPCPIPNHCGLNWGIPVSYIRLHQTKERKSRDKGKVTKEKTARPLTPPEKENIRKKNSLRRARSALRPLRAPGLLLACPRPPLSLAISADALHPTRVLSRNSRTAPVAPSLAPWGVPSGTAS